MSDDGAHLGYGTEAALRGALGGEEPARRMTVTEMRAYIEAAPARPRSYDDAGRAAAKVILDFLERHPEASDLPADSDGAFDLDESGNIVPDSYHMVREGLWDYLRRIEPDLYARHRKTVFAELTGFSWGWAVNAARRCLELTPVPNPAIVEFGGDVT